MENAVADFRDLTEVLTAPEQEMDAAGQAEVLAAAEVLIGEMVEQAPLVDRLSRIAGGQKSRAARRDVGDALLKFRDRGKSLSRVTALLLQWSVGDRKGEAEIWRECVRRLESRP